MTQERHRQYVIGADIGGTRLRLALADSEGSIWLGRQIAKLNYDLVAGSYNLELRALACATRLSHV